MHDSEHREWLLEEKERLEKERRAAHHGAFPGHKKNSENSVEGEAGGAVPAKERDKEDDEAEPEDDEKEAKFTEPTDDDEYYR